MTIDDVLQAMRRLRKPEALPFFAARVTATVTRERKRAPLALKIYWFLVVFAATPLLGTWFGVGVAVAVGALFAFPGLGAAISGALFTSPRGSS
jgi:hypothetical protein